MIKGVEVSVCRPVNATPDRFGNLIPGEWTCETVSDVLVSPGTTSDMEASRPDGVTVAYTCQFPKTYSQSLEGCRIELPAPWSCTCNVIGNPTPYIDANTPTRWHMQVELEAAHG